MEEKTVKVDSISCGHCVANIKREIEEIEGVDSVEGNADTKEVRIRWRDPASWDTISKTLDDIGYPAEG